jgi:hypothetical protein
VVAAQPFKMTEPDPDQLLKSLDAEIAMAKFRRSGTGANRNAFRMAGIMVLVIGTAIALLVLQYMASEITSSHPIRQPAPAADASK